MKIFIIILLIISIIPFVTVPIYNKRKKKSIEKEFEDEREREQSREYELKVIRLEKGLKSKYKWLNDHFRVICLEKGFGLYNGDQFCYTNRNLTHGSEEQKMEERLVKLERIMSRFNPVISRNQSYYEKDIYETFSVLDMLNDRVDKEFKEELVPWNRDKRLKQLLNK